MKSSTSLMQVLASTYFELKQSNEDLPFYRMTANGEDF
jgi:hypothetical protein